MSYWKLFGVAFALQSTALCAQADFSLSRDNAPNRRASLAVGDATVTVSGAEPGSTYYFLGLGRRIEGPELTRRYFRLEASTDANNDGTIDLEIEEGVPEASIWAAASRSGGAILYSVPPRFPHAHPRVLEDDYLSEGPQGPLLLSGEQLVVLFRRGVGAWVWRGRADVAPSEDPTLPDRLLLSAASFEALAASDPPLDDFLPGDVLFSLDQRTFDLRRLVFAGDRR